MFLRQAVTADQTTRHHDLEGRQFHCQPREYRNSQTVTLALSSINRLFFVILTKGVFTDLRSELLKATWMNLHLQRVESQQDLWSFLRCILSPDCVYKVVM
jgi:hypothetical protein